MAALDFLRRKHNVTAAYFDHGTEFSKKAKTLVSKYCVENNIELVTSKISRRKKATESFEEYWRNERIAWLHSLDRAVVTAHNLDDVIEWYIFSALHGKPGITPYKNKNIIRPFLITPKSKLKDWDNGKGVLFLLDPANADRKFMRSIIRYDIMPKAFEVNPGLYKTFTKMIEKEYKGKV